MPETRQRNNRLIPIVWLAIGVAAGVSLDRVFHREPASTKPVVPDSVKETAASVSNSVSAEATHTMPGPDILPPLEKVRRLGRASASLDLQACLSAINELPAKDCLAAMDAFRGLPDEDLRVLQR